MEGRIEEFQYQFDEDFNSLLDEMEEWQLKLQAKTSSCRVPPCTIRSPVLLTASAFRNNIAALMNDPSAKTISALYFLDGDNFKFINDTWRHAAGDCVLIEAASRMVEFGENATSPTAWAADEVAMILYGVHTPA